MNMLKDFKKHVYNQEVKEKFKKNYIKLFDIKNTIYKIKYSLNGIDSRLYIIEENSSDFEDIAL